MGWIGARSYGQWLDALVTVGRKPFDHHVYRQALEGYYPTGDLAELTVPVTVTVSGKATANHHYNTDCAAITSDFTVRSVTFARVGTEPTPHTCLNDYDTYVPTFARTEAALLHDARALTRPYRSAQYSSAYSGRPTQPYDNLPVTDGLLASLTAAVRTYVGAHPDRHHMADLLIHLDMVELLWNAAMTGNASYLPPDGHDQRPHMMDAEGLRGNWADLQGTVRQVQWAKQLRYEACMSSSDPNVHELARESSHALTWIIRHLDPTLTFSR